MLEMLNAMTPPQRHHQQPGGGSTSGGGADPLGAATSPLSLSPASSPALQESAGSSATSCSSSSSSSSSASSSPPAKSVAPQEVAAPTKVSDQVKQTRASDELQQCERLGHDDRDQDDESTQQRVAAGAEDNIGSDASTPAPATGPGVEAPGNSSNHSTAAAATTTAITTTNHRNQGNRIEEEDEVEEEEEKETAPTNANAQTTETPIAPQASTTHANAPDNNNSSQHGQPASFKPFNQGNQHSQHHNQNHHNASFASARSSSSSSAAAAGNHNQRGHNQHNSHHHHNHHHSHGNHHGHLHSHQNQQQQQQHHHHHHHHHQHHNHLHYNNNHKSNPYSHGGPMGVSYPGADHSQSQAAAFEVPAARSELGVPPAASAGSPSGGPPHYVDLHVSAGECVSLQLLDGQEQVVAGPATITMISQQQAPPVPIPVQVPHGHMIHQIADEHGTLKHIILSVVDSDKSPPVDSNVIDFPHGSFRVDSLGELVSTTSEEPSGSSSEYPKQQAITTVISPQPAEGAHHHSQRPPPPPTLNQHHNSTTYYANYNGCAAVQYGGADAPEGAQTNSDPSGAAIEAAATVVAAGEGATSASVASSCQDQDASKQSSSFKEEEAKHQEGEEAQDENDGQQEAAATPTNDDTTSSLAQDASKSSNSYEGQQVVDLVDGSAAAATAGAQMLSYAPQPQMLAADPHGAMALDGSLADPSMMGGMYGYPAACCCCCYCDPNAGTAAAMAAAQAAVQPGALGLDPAGMMGAGSQQPDVIVMGGAPLSHEAGRGELASGGPSASGGAGGNSRASGRNSAAKNQSSAYGHHASHMMQAQHQAPPYHSHLMATSKEFVPSSQLKSHQAGGKGSRGQNAYGKQHGGKSTSHHHQGQHHHGADRTGSQQHNNGYLGSTGHHYQSVAYNQHHQGAYGGPLMGNNNNHNHLNHASDLGGPSYKPPNTYGGAYGSGQGGSLASVVKSSSSSHARGQAIGGGPPYGSRPTADQHAESLLSTHYHRHGGSASSRLDDHQHGAAKQRLGGGDRSNRYGAGGANLSARHHMLGAGGGLQPPSGLHSNLSTSSGSVSPMRPMRRQAQQQQAHGGGAYHGQAQVNGLRGPGGLAPTSSLQHQAFHANPILQQENRGFKQQASAKGHPAEGPRTSWHQPPLPPSGASGAYGKRQTIVSNQDAQFPPGPPLAAGASQEQRAPNHYAAVAAAAAAASASPSPLIASKPHEGAARQSSSGGQNRADLEASKQPAIVRGQQQAPPKGSQESPGSSGPDTPRSSRGKHKSKPDAQVRDEAAQDNKRVTSADKSLGLLPPVASDAGRKSPARQRRARDKLGGKKSEAKGSPSPSKTSSSAKRDPSGSSKSAESSPKSTKSGRESPAVNDKELSSSPSGKQVDSPPAGDRLTGSRSSHSLKDETSPPARKKSLKSPAHSSPTDAQVDERELSARTSKATSSPSNDHRATVQTRHVEALNEEEVLVVETTLDDEGQAQEGAPTFRVTMRSSQSQKIISQMPREVPESLAPVNEAKSTQTTPQKGALADSPAKPPAEAAATQAVAATPVQPVDEGELPGVVGQRELSKTKRRQSSLLSASSGGGGGVTKAEQQFRINSLPQLRVLNLNCVSISHNSVSLRWSYIPSVAEKHGILIGGHSHHNQHYHHNNHHHYHHGHGHHHKNPALFDHFVIESSSSSKNTETNTLSAAKAVFQGCAMACKVNNLTPEKIYHFRVRRTALVSSSGDQEHLAVSEILSVTLPSSQQLHQSGQASGQISSSATSPSSASSGPNGSLGGHNHKQAALASARTNNHTSSQTHNGNKGNHNHQNQTIRVSNLLKQCRNKLATNMGKLVQRSLTRCSDTKFAGFLLIIFTMFAMLLAILIHYYIIAPVNE